MAVVLTSTVPVFNTPDEHRQLVSSTPQNFADIPPILRHKQPGVSVQFHPAIIEHNGWSRGTLYVIDSYLVFIQDADGKGFQIEYPTIILHAISRTEGQAPSLYCQLNDPSNVDPESEEQIRELKITPDDSAALNTIFEALSLCASLHPDKAMLSDDDDDDEAFVDTGNFDVFAGTADEEMDAVGRAALEYLESITDYSCRRESKSV